MFRIGLIGAVALLVVVAMFPQQQAQAEELDFATSTVARDVETEATIASSWTTKSKAQAESVGAIEEADFTRAGLTIGDAILATYRGDCAGGACGGPLGLFADRGEGGGPLRRAAGAPLRIWRWAAPLKRASNLRPFGGRLRLRG